MHQIFSQYLNKYIKTHKIYNILTVNLKQKKGKNRQIFFATKSLKQKYFSKNMV